MKEYDFIIASGGEISKENLEILMDVERKQSSNKGDNTK